jgi:drug/metabolite transporter (DMT)-like permease
MWMFFILLLILFEGIADVFAKEWSLKQRPIIWVLAIGAYVVANTFWLYSLKNGAGLGRGAVIFSIASEIIAVLLALVFYKEQLDRVQIFGMILGTLAILMVLWPDIRG